MLPRLAPLALVMVAGCEPTPDYSSSKLVGWWRNQTPATNSNGSNGTTIREELFRANGYMKPGYGNYVRWVLVEEDDRHVVIDYPQDIPIDTSRRRTLEFLSKDRMREVGNGNHQWDRFEGPQ